ncbi:hypothetical protein K466DRAFT_665891 [Polyporus arcularius HHB13444]|uniref:Uncharacterized protein n=1 Tax=Polyporus arcularius HHB13444 TaxID=1314778 RepID=A0A5C3P130_9APHY|nr:hypothetical protein K466DRAFT_665891 [Polyporus arcularius HHB13444]
MPTFPIFRLSCVRATYKLTPQRWEEQHEVTPGSLPGRKRKQGSDEQGASRPSCPLRHHQHYRLVVEEVALPLSEFHHGRQLVSKIGDCIIALYEALTPSRSFMAT